MHQPLPDHPFVWRLEEVLAELLFEGGEAHVAVGGQIFDRDVGEDMLSDDLLEALFRQIHIAKDLVFETAVSLCEDQVDQFGQFEMDRDGVVQIEILAESTIDTAEKVLEGRVCRSDDMGLLLAFGAAMVVGDGQLIGEIQVVEDTGQLL